MCSTSLNERVLRFAGMASARAMLSDSIVAATPPPASSRNLRRLTARISTTHLTSTGNAPNAALVSASSLLAAEGQRQIFVPGGCRTPGLPSNLKGLGRALAVDGLHELGR